MLTSDPRMVSLAAPIPLLTFDEATELAYFGAAVLHPSAMQPALQSGSLCVRVKNSYNRRALLRAGTTARPPPRTARWNSQGIVAWTALIPCASEGSRILPGLDFFKECPGFQTCLQGGIFLLGRRCHGVALDGEREKYHRLGDTN